MEPGEVRRLWVDGEPLPAIWTPKGLAREAGLVCELEVVPRRSHDFPQDFPDRLLGRLSQLCEEG